MLLLELNQGPGTACSVPSPEGELCRDGTSTGAVVTPSPPLSEITKALATQDVMVSGTMASRVVSVSDLMAEGESRLSKPCIYRCQ